MMKSSGVFLGGLGAVLATNLMLIGVCSSAPLGPAPSPVLPPPLPPPPPAVTRVLPRSPEIGPPPVPLGLFVWGCGAHLFLDPEGALPLPVCPPMRLR
jgi:hypothetical protein